ncbi:hypothetical protein AH2_00053 [Burkholderia phage vB_BceS_AH2]|uniref:Virion structural protein n=1 Tax=Burkholderia phage vB_BceS_AH2 TaxID=1133022 RepID=I6NTN2_9CAUD|nr:structural protein [Burkholderia phage vB_BceS_AH2]AEY69559.1 hypothetical protein AH2_00053 [Burkholderia phage vB_BceS_AH2]
MAFTTGTAAHHADLIDKLRQWLVGTVGWTEMYWKLGASVTDETFLVVKGPGAGAGREVYVTLHATADAAAPYYSIGIRGAIGYQAGAAWGNNPGEGPPTYLNLWQNPINYWFYANARRFVIIAKCSTNYMSAYAGMFLPWADPTQYPFPLYVAADCGVKTGWNTVNSARRMFCDPGYWNLGAGVIRDTDGMWQNVLNQQQGNSNDFTYGQRRGAAYFLWPWASGSENDFDDNGWAGRASGNTVGGAVDAIVPTKQGERLIVPAHINHTQRPALGALDGIYMPFGSGLVTEQTVAAGGKTLRAFQNIHRNSANDFFLIDEV